MVRHLRHPRAGLVATAFVALLMLMPTAIEYAVMLAGISASGLD
jgi:hypothetical protein